MGEIVIKVKNVSKQYRLGAIGTGSLAHDFNRWWHVIRGKEDPYATVGEINDRTKAGGSNYVWSLKDVNFNIEQGDAVGVIGRNGAGKSTLLKILSQVTAPTSGSIKIKGRISSLLEVGTGFHPDLSGRENIYLNGSILGMRKKEIAKKFDEIVDFAGIERYIDTPVKRYSSGMYVRLAFGVAAHLESEILIVDEVLAVGDSEFQKKCLGKMRDVTKSDGRTVLFVSHNIAAVRRLCNKGIYLVNGKVYSTGDIESVIGDYTSVFTLADGWEGVSGTQEIDVLKTYVRPVVDSDNLSQEEYWATENKYEVGVKFEVKKQLTEIGVGFNIYNHVGNPIVRCFYNDYSDILTLKKGVYLCKFSIPEYTLASGKYSVVFDVAIPRSHKVHTEEIDLFIHLYSKNKLGNRYNTENNLSFNSIVRPNWLDSIVSLSGEEIISS